MRFGAGTVWISALLLLGCTPVFGQSTRNGAYSWESDRQGQPVPEDDLDTDSETGDSEDEYAEEGEPQGERGQQDGRGRRGARGRTDRGDRTQPGERHRRADRRADRQADRRQQSEDRPGSPPAVARALMGLVEKETRRLGEWEQYADRIDRQVDRTWTEMGWTDEADVFARETLTRVTAIPPWRMQDRLEALCDAATERYDLSNGQRQELRGMIYREVGRFAMRHAGMLLKHTREVVQARVQGKPFTPEMVARWVRESDEAFAEIQRQIDAFNKEFKGMLDADQQDVYARDVESYLRRQAFFERLREDWRRGEWQPSDWGLEDDPAYARVEMRMSPGLLEGSEADGGKHEETAHLRRMPPLEDASAWRRFVEWFVVYYKLDDGQRQTAYNILKELELRAADYRYLHADEFAYLERGDEEREELVMPLEDMFRELVDRLERIPRTAQIREAARTTEEQPEAVEEPEVESTPEAPSESRVADQGQ